MTWYSGSSKSKQDDGDESETNEDDVDESETFEESPSKHTKFIKQRLA